MDIILHIFGACADNHAHFDLTDLLIYGGGTMSTIHYSKNWIKTHWRNIRNKS